jgi:hypothetical protein
MMMDFGSVLSWDGQVYSAEKTDRYTPVEEFVTTAFHGIGLSITMSKLIAFT